MEKLNIPQGKYHTNELQTRVECDNRLVATCLDGEGNAFTTASQNIDKQKALAVLFSDAGNNYNTTGKSPSELKQERDELLEALREIKNSEHGTYKGTATYLKKVASDAIENFLTKHSTNV